MAKVCSNLKKKKYKNTIILFTVKKDVGTYFGGTVSHDLNSSSLAEWKNYSNNYQNRKNFLMTGQNSVGQRLIN